SRDLPGAGCDGGVWPSQGRPTVLHAVHRRRHWSQVVFEVLSPNNTGPEMARKRAFYERYGVEEYYEYDPDRGQLRGWQRLVANWCPLQRCGAGSARDLACGSIWKKGRWCSYTRTAGVLSPTRSWRWNERQRMKRLSTSASAPSRARAPARRAGEGARRTRATARQARARTRRAAGGALAGAGD